MILNGATQQFGFEYGYVGESRDRQTNCVFMQARLRQVGEGTRVLIIPIPGQVIDVLDCRNYSSFMEEALCQGAEYGKIFPNDIDKGIRLLQEFSDEDLEIHIAHENTKGLAERVSKTWGSEVMINGELSAAIDAFFPTWDIVVVKIPPGSSTAIAPIGILYQGPKIKFKGAECYFYPAYSNISSRTSLYNVYQGEIPKLNSLDERKLAIGVGVHNGKLVASSATCVYSKPLPDIISRNVVTYTYDSRKLLNAGMLIKKRSGDPAFSADIVGRKVRGVSEINL